MDYLEKVRSRFAHLVEESRLGHSPVQVVGARSLSPEEAIGRPERQDFPLMQGKEVMIQATFRGALGQAYTDQPGSYQGTLGQVLSLTLDSNFQRAVFLATLNAVLRYLGMAQKTVHCQGQEPEICARELARYIGERFGRPKIAFIGLQPAMVEALAASFPLRVTDLNPDNVGREKCGVLVEDASRTPEVIAASDLVLATGTTAVNATLSAVVGQKPVIFYGVTISGIARLAGYEQYCAFGH